MRIRGVLAFIGLISILSLFPNSALALQQKDFTLTPLRTEFNIAPGTSQDGVLSVTNTTDVDMTVQFSAEAFSVINQQYDYAFDAESKLSDWVYFAKDKIQLAPGAPRDVKYTVGVPLSAEPGGRYISLFASTDTGDSGTGVNSRQRIGSLLYITVLGDVSREGHLLGLSSPLFVGDVSRFSMTIQNTGTTHFKSRYSVTLNNIFGGKESATTTNETLILPGTIRAVLDYMPTPSWPGAYKVTYSIGLGDTPAVTREHYIIYLPSVFLAGLVTAIIALISMRFYLKSRRSLK